MFLGAAREVDDREPSVAQGHARRDAVARARRTIEAIVDRFRVKEDLRLRLAESFETALRLADGVAIVAHMDPPEDGEAAEAVELADAGGHGLEPTTDGQGLGGKIH
mgnify:CR=1 FL=1